MYYKLIKIESPTFKFKDNTNRIVLSDPGVGGIKLVYQIAEFRKKFTKLSEKKQYIVFLKPYKEILGKREDCSKGEWGNTSSSLSNVWFISTTGDYKNFKKSYINLRFIKVEDQNIISALNKQKEEFEIGQQSKTPIKLSLTMKIRLYHANLMDKFINHKNQKNVRSKS